MSSFSVSQKLLGFYKYFFMLYAQNNIFLKGNPNMKFWIIYILVQILFFGNAFGRFSKCLLFSIFGCRPTTVADNFTQFYSQIFIEIWFWLYDATHMANCNLLSNAKHEMLRYQMQFKLQTANRREVTKNSKLKYTRKLV